jgi:hypothetical protein
MEELLEGLSSRPLASARALAASTSAGPGEAARDELLAALAHEEDGGVRGRTMGARSKA